MALKILSVDDSRTIRLVVSHAFQPYDCLIREAMNGAEGLATAAREKPDLILLDLSMPVMDGLTMLAKLKADPELKAIPVIMLTAESGSEDVSYIRRLGVSDYLLKPFREEELVARVSRLLPLRARADATSTDRSDDREPGREPIQA